MAAILLKKLVQSCDASGSLRRSITRPENLKVQVNMKWGDCMKWKLMSHPDFGDLKLVVWTRSLLFQVSPASPSPLSMPTVGPFKLRLRTAPPCRSPRTAPSPCTRITLMSWPLSSKWSPSLAAQVIKKKSQSFVNVVSMFQSQQNKGNKCLSEGKDF